MSALAALAAAEAALDVGALDDDSSGGTGEEHGGQARPAVSALGFEDHGSELLARLEDALVAEARARPSACARALGKAAELAGEPAALAGVHQREPGVWVEDALARSLSRLEDTLLLRARGAGDQQGGATNREAIARADQALRSADALPHRAGAAPLKTGVRAAQLKRPSSAPLVHPPASDGGSDLRIRQRAYDDQRAGRVRTPQHAVVRPAPKVFDANATCNHCFKPGRVRRDENGRLQPKLSSRLARMSVPTFMGLPLAHSESEPNWGAVARDATEMIWQKTVDALAQQEHPPVSAHMGFGGDSVETKRRNMAREPSERNRKHRADRHSLSPGRSPGPLQDHHRGRRSEWISVRRNAYGSPPPEGKGGGKGLAGSQHATAITETSSGAAGREPDLPRSQARSKVLKAPANKRTAAYKGGVPPPAQERVTSANESSISVYSEEEELRRTISELSERLAHITASRSQRQPSQGGTSTRDQDPGDAAPGPTGSARPVADPARQQGQARATAARAPQDFQSFVNELEDGLDERQGA